MEYYLYFIKEESEFQGMLSNLEVPKPTCHVNHALV